MCYRFSHTVTEFANITECDIGGSILDVEDEEMRMYWFSVNWNFASGE
jgi:hypothetical protein